MKAKLKAVVTITQEYEADSRNYFNTDFIEDMIEIDTKNFQRDPELFISDMISMGAKVDIEITGKITAYEKQ